MSFIYSEELKTDIIKQFPENILIRYLLKTNDVNLIEAITEKYIQLGYETEKDLMDDFRDSEKHNGGNFTLYENDQESFRKKMAILITAPRLALRCMMEIKQYKEGFVEKAGQIAIDDSKLSR